MGNKLSGKSSQVAPDPIKPAKHTDKVAESSKENTLKNSKQPFSCGVFKRKTSSIFLDYEGLSFDEYFRRKQSGSKSSTRNSLETTSHSLLSTTSKEETTVYSRVTSVSDNQIYSQISDKHATRDPHIYYNIDQNDEKRSPSYESISDLNHRDKEPGRQLKYSMERQLSNHTEEADDITSFYCVENDSEKDEFEPLGHDPRDSDQFYRPWSLTQSPPSSKRESYDPPNTRPDSSSSWKGPDSRKSSNHSKNSDHDPNMLPRRRSESRRSIIKSNRNISDGAMSRRVSIAHLKPQDLETNSLHNSILNSYGNAKEDIISHKSTQNSHASAESFTPCPQSDQTYSKVFWPASTEGQNTSDLNMRLGAIKIDLTKDHFDCTDSYFESQSQDFPSFSVDIDRLRNQVSDMTDNEPSDSELNQDFEKCQKGRIQQSELPFDEGFQNGSYQTGDATEDDIPDLEVEEDTSYRRSTSSTQSSVSDGVHPLGSVQTREIRGTWVVILAQLQKVGVQCIVDLFELHPFVREHFKEILIQYGKLDPENDNALQNLLENHAKLVMNIVHELVVNIDNLDNLSERLQKLGLFHVRNAVPERYLDIMGPIFCNAVRPILLKNNIWSSEVEESWMEFFKVLTTAMKKSYESVENVKAQLELSPTQKCVIVATWHSIFLKHMNFMGKQLFVDLFKVEPNILKYFDAFRDVGLTNLLQSRSFQNHGVRIMNLVKFAVENLDNPEKLQDHMLILGRLHVKKGIESKYLDLMGPTFCQAIRPMVMAEGQWSIDIEAAWIQLFKILNQMMKVAYEEKEVIGVFPSPRQIGLILESWGDIEDGLDEIGMESFKKLFASHSDIQAYFPSMKKLSSTDLDMSREIKEHSVRVMGLVRLYVENIYDIEKITQKIEQLGKSHFQRGIKSEYIDVMGPVFCNTIRPLLIKKDLWSLELEEVWLTLFKKISETMKKGYPREKRKSSKFLKQFKAH